MPDIHLNLKLLVGSIDIDKRIDVMAKEIVDKYGTNRPLFVCLLKGAVPFASKLMFQIAQNDPSFQPEIDYIKTSTYGNGRQAGQTQLVVPLGADTIVDGRVAIIIDDVLDTGRTHTFVSDYLHGLGAKRVDLVVLAQKSRHRDNWETATIYGFEVPDEWLTGMGCDDARVAIEGNRWISSLNSVE